MGLLAEEIVILLLIFFFGWVYRWSFGYEMKVLIRLGNCKRRK